MGWPDRAAEVGRVNRRPVWQRLIDEKKRLDAEEALRKLAVIQALWAARNDPNVKMRIDWKRSPAEFLRIQ